MGQAHFRHGGWNCREGADSAWCSTRDLAFGLPVIDACGELVGLIFDGNIQSLPAHFLCDGRLNRAISGDVRRIEALRTVYETEALVSELPAAKIAAAQ